MNEVISAMQTRRSIRKFRPDPVPMETIRRIAEAGSYAPSGMGRQSPVILAVTDRTLRDRLSRMNAAVMGAAGDPFYGAPAVLVVLADRSVPTCVYDGSLVMGNLMLAAHSEGVDSCWIHRAREEFDSPEGREILKSLGLEGNYEGIGHCILGYADGPQPAPAPRKADYIRYI